jgi:hypothetical protein
MPAQHAQLMAVPIFQSHRRSSDKIVSAVGSGAGIEKAALLLLFAGTAFNWISSYLFAAAYLDLPEWVVTRFYLYICIPALVFSLCSYTRFGGFGKSPALLTCVFALLTGLLWTTETELGRGLLKFAAFAVTVPMASLVVKHDYKKQCIQAFVWGTAASRVLAMAESGVGSSAMRFGTLIDASGRSSNPNNVGAQAAFAGCLGALWFLQRPRDTPAAGRKSRFAIAASTCVVLFLVYSLLLTASRTAFIALAGTLIWIAVVRSRRSLMALVCCALALISVASMLWVADSIEPDSNGSFYSQLESRLFQDKEGTVGTLGTRTLIWTFAGDLLTNDYRWVLGFGTGGVDKALGSFFELGQFAIGTDGIRRLHSHSTFIEWMLMLGLAGAAIPLWLAIRVCATAWRMDCQENGVDRTSLVVFAVLLSFGSVINTEVFWMAYGTLLWAMLSPQPTLAMAHKNTLLLHGADLRARL